jgi:hypothetical protein
MARLLHYISMQAITGGEKNMNNEKRLQILYLMLLSAALCTKEHPRKRNKPAENPLSGELLLPPPDPRYL